MTFSIQQVTFGHFLEQANIALSQLVGLAVGAERLALKKPSHAPDVSSCK